VKSSLAADLAVLEELLEDLTALIRPLDEACLNWTPLPSDTNSIAAMVVHTLGSTESWLARALGESLSRDREAEFRSRATAAELVDRIERTRADARRRFEQLDAVDPGTTRRTRRMSRNQDVDVTVAWCIEHALIHAGEHWGQIQLTRQIYAAR
jgi:uncharacterized damage-inducible protein DinB